MSSTTISERTLQDRPSYTRRSPQERVGLVQFPFRHHPYHQKPASDQYTHTRRYTSKHHQRRTPSYESAPLLTRLSNSSSPRSPTNTLLDRIGAQAISVEEEEEGAINSEDDVQVTLQPRLDTPEPGELEREDHEPVVVEPDEVDRFLESVIGPPPPRVPDMSPSVEETRRLYDWVSEGSEECPPGLMYIKQESTTHSPLPPFMAGAEADNPRISTHTSLSRSSSMPTPHPHDHVAPTAPRLSTAVLEQCREHLAPVVQAASVAGAARDTHSRPPQCTTRADAQQCTTTFRLSDDQCTALHCLAKDMRAQLHHHHASAREQKTNGRESSESAEPWGRRTDLGSHPDHRTPWSRRRDLSARHESVDTPFRRDSDMTLVDVPSSKDASSVLMKGSVGVEKHYDSLPKEERMSPALSTTDAFNNGIVDRPESIFRCLDLEETATPVCPPVPEVQGFTGHGIWSKHDGSDMPDVHDVEITVGEKLFSPEIARINASVRVYCLSKSKEAPETDLTLEGLENSISQWPRKGTLIIQVNPELSQGKTWLPYALESTPFLDVTSCISPGKNMFRCISLSSLSDFTFVVCAFPLPPDEVTWRNYDWQSTLLSPTSHASTTFSSFAELAITT